MISGDGDLSASAYAPYRDPRDYILSWTDAIWIDRGLGRLTEHDDKRVRVHTAYGETYDWDYVVSNSLQKVAAFPNGGGRHGEDVIWEQRGRNGFISSHRVFKSGTHTGFWTYRSADRAGLGVAHGGALPGVIRSSRSGWSATSGRC